MKLPNDISALTALVKELLLRVEKLEAENALLRAENSFLRAENAELRSQLAQNSKNSHRPPSSDYKSNNAKTKPAFPRGKGKKRGGQEGHSGKTLEMIDSPDERVVHAPDRCSCGRSLSGIPTEEVSRRQVFDLPEPRLVVTEHVSIRCTCPSCGKQVSSGFPEGVNSHVQYGNRVKSLVVLLLNTCNLSYARTRQLFFDLYGYELNEGTQSSAQQSCHELLATSESVIKEKLVQSPVNHFDETGLRVAGGNHWMHCCSNDLYTHLFVHEKRGNKAIGSKESILPEYDGIAVHDCWQTYFLYDKPGHALCNAHIVRELRAVSESGRNWSGRMAELLLYAYHMSKDGTDVVKDFGLVSRQYDRICKMADKEEPPPIKKEGARRPKQTKGRNLLDRLVKHKHAVLAFAKNENVPFTNNQAERDIRPAKTKIKVSGCFRTLKGAQAYARILAFISTTRKNKLNVFNQLLATFKGNNFLDLSLG